MLERPSWCRATQVHTCSQPRPRVIAFFVHIPKTGGSSIDSFFCQDARFANSSNGIQYHTSRHSLRRVLAALSTHLQSGTQPASDMYVSLHGGFEPSWIEVSSQLVAIRSRLRAAGMTSAIFTLLREPRAWLESAHAYYHVSPKSSRPNPQCHYLMHGWSGFPYRGASVPSHENGTRVLRTLQLMDWVGTLESFNRTWSWLHHHLGMCGEPTRANVGRRSVSKPALFPNQDRLPTSTEIDEMLYSYAASLRRASTSLNL